MESVLWKCKTRKNLILGTYIRDGLFLCLDDTQGNVAVINLLRCTCSIGTAPSIPTSKISFVKFSPARNIKNT